MLKNERLKASKAKSNAFQSIANERAMHAFAITTLGSACIAQSLSLSSYILSYVLCVCLAVFSTQTRNQPSTMKKRSRNCYRAENMQNVKLLFAHKALLLKSTSISLVRLSVVLSLSPAERSPFSLLLFTTNSLY